MHEIRRLSPNVCFLRLECGNKADHEDDEVFITSCDLTVMPTTTMTQMKGCIIRSNCIYEEHDDSDHYPERIPHWKKILCCHSCCQRINDGLWMLAVRCANYSPDRYNANKLCGLLDLVCKPFFMFMDKLIYNLNLLH